LAGSSLAIEKLTVWYEDARGEARRVVHELSLAIEPGERVAMVGRNGAGKTSLLLALVGAVPFSGSVTIAGQALERHTLETLRRGIGFVFADPHDQLFCETVQDEVAYGPRLRGSAPEAVEARVVRALSAVNLGGFELRPVAALSLGEKRRLAIATVLSYEAALVIVDEPTASLDPVARHAVLSAIAALDATVVFATHDLEAARELGARVLVFDAGRLLADGPASQILADLDLLERAGLFAPPLAPTHLPPAHPHRSPPRG
jgi:cobalt/nickel transport system ATP-binding protein